MNERKSARLFYAVWPDETLRSQMGEAVAWLKLSATGKWVRTDNLHLTLAFLGEVEETRWPDLDRIGAKAAGTGFTVVFDRVEFWPWNGIICLGSSETPEALKELAKRLAGQLGEAGFAIESRPYRAHVTLARKGRADRTRIALAEPIVWTMRSFCLVESRREPEGSVYVPWASWPLTDPEMARSDPQNRPPQG